MWSHRVRHDWSDLAAAAAASFRDEDKIYFQVNKNWEGLLLVGLLKKTYYKNFFELEAQDLRQHSSPHKLMNQEQQ